MASKTLITVLVCLVNVFTISGTSGANIHLYSDANFTELISEIHPTAACTPVPGNIGTVYSIKTDTCFIAYNLIDCITSRTMKFSPGSTVVPPCGLGRRWSFRSLHSCTEVEGGNQLNLDITERFTEESLIQDVMESYKNVCSCVNVPQYVQIMPSWSINNHHNDLLAYFEPNCSESKFKSSYIAAGNTRVSENIFGVSKWDTSTKKLHYIQSFGPNPNSTYFQNSCIFSDVTPLYTESEVKDPVENVSNTTNSNISVDIDVQEHIHNLTTKVMELQKEIDQTRQNQDKHQKDMDITLIKLFDNVTQQMTNMQFECNKKIQVFTERISKLENFTNSFSNIMTSQKEEFLEVIAKLQTFLQDKF